MSVSLAFCFIYSCNDAVNLPFTKDVYFNGLWRLHNMVFIGKENLDWIMEMTTIFITSLFCLKLLDLVDTGMFSSPVCCH